MRTFDSINDQQILSAKNQGVNTLGFADRVVSLMKAVEVVWT